MSGHASLEPPAWLVGARRGLEARQFWLGAATLVEALAARYPRALAELPESWWSEPALAELLVATAHWRLALDEGLIGLDARAEPEFHSWLSQLGARLGADARAALVDEPAGPDPGGPSGAARRAQALASALALMPVHPPTNDSAPALDPRTGHPPAPPSWSER